MPIFFLTGIFGMNFGAQTWMQKDLGWHLWVGIAGMIAIIVLQIVFCRRKRWM